MIFLPRHYLASIWMTMLVQNAPCLRRCILGILTHGVRPPLDHTHLVRKSGPGSTGSKIIFLRHFLPGVKTFTFLKALQNPASTLMIARKFSKNTVYSP